MPIFPLSILQALLLCGGQVLVKVALSRIDRFEWTWAFAVSQLTNWWWLACGICFCGAGALWTYILRHYPFSMAYPLSSMAYIFGMIAAMVLFREHVSASGWFGICLILLGCWFVSR